jgi:hypothetical protein
MSKGLKSDRARRAHRIWGERRGDSRNGQVASGQTPKIQIKPELRSDGAVVGRADNGPGHDKVDSPARPAGDRTARISSCSPVRTAKESTSC